MLKYWIVDAFTDKAFKGNPAAVVLLNETLSDATMQNLASEINLSETAFVLKTPESFLLRWFTPKSEVDLCGHATLSAAHILIAEAKLVQNEVVFQTKFVGDLKVSKQEDLYVMDFPSRLGERVELTDIPLIVASSLGHPKIVDAYQSRDLMLVLENESSVRHMNVDFAQLHKHDSWVIVTAQADKGLDYDIVSRFFCAGDGIDEDPVTGSAHCTIVPYWSKRLGKPSLTAYQASERGGYLLCEDQGERVILKGKALTMMEGTIRPLLAA